MTSGQSPARFKQTDSMASSIALKAAKNELRSLMKEKLSAISDDSVRIQSAAVYQSILSLEPYQKARRIGIYLSMPTAEIQTDRIVRHALECGKKVFVPFLRKNPAPSPDTPRSVMDMVDLLSLSDYEGLARDRWGIPTVDSCTIGQREQILGDSSKNTGPLEMILMPGVAFQHDLDSGLVRRLGHGKGFYDYFLHKYSESERSHAKSTDSTSETGLLLYGLALEEQLLDSKDSSLVPVGEQDRQLHGLVVGRGIVLTAPEIHKS